MENLAWNEKIFGVNQLMFHIWDFLEFPTPLSLTSVHSSWKQRLWPCTTLPKNIISSSSSISLFKEEGNKKRKSKYYSSSASARKRKRTFKLFHKWEKEIENFTPQKKELDSSITSLKTLYGSHKPNLSLILKKLPKCKSHISTMLEQLFTFYPTIDHIEFNGGNKTHGYNTITSYYPIITSEQINYGFTTTYTDERLIKSQMISSILRIWNKINTKKDKTISLVHGDSYDFSNFWYFFFKSIHIKDMFAGNLAFMSPDIYENIFTCTSHLKIDLIGLTSSVIYKLIRRVGIFPHSETEDSKLQIIEIREKKELCCPPPSSSSSKFCHENTNFLNMVLNVDLEGYCPNLEILILESEIDPFSYIEKQTLWFTSCPSTLKEVHMSSNFELKEETKKLFLDQNVKIFIL